MKKLKLFFLLPLMICAAVTFVGCEDSDTDGGVTGDDVTGDDATDEDEDEATGDELTSNFYYDIWVALDDTGNAMNTGSTMLIDSYDSLEDADEVVNFEGVGADVTSILHDETLIKDGYYYQIPQTEGRFGKYKVTNDMCGVIKELQLPDDAVLAARKYCGDWIDDDTLVIMGSINSYQDIAWVKINTSEMKVISSGTLTLDMSEIDWKDEDKSYTLSTSGLVSYRAEDDRLIYAYSVKRRATDSATKNTSFDVSVAFIDPSDMSIKETVTDSRVDQTYGTAFGELLQNTTFFTESGDYYICCRNSTNVTDGYSYQSGFIRIKAGETKIDDTYLGLYDLDEKVCSAEYLGGDEVLIYAQNPQVTTSADDWDSSLYSCYYSVWNMADDTRVEIECDGAKLPYCTGSLTTQLFTVADGKAYIGTNSESYVGIYVYDIEEKSAAKGATITSGYELLRIVAHEK